MIPFQNLVFKQHESKNSEYHEGNNLLNHFQLQQAKRPAIFLITQSVGGHHEAIFHKSNKPTGQDEAKNPCFFKEFQVLEFQVAIPRERHEDIGEDKQEDGVEAFHF